MSKTSRDSFYQLQEWRDALRPTVSSEELIRAIENEIEQESDLERVVTLNTFLAREHRVQGNETAAAAIDAKHPYKETDRWYFDWKRKNPGANGIPVLEERLRQETHPLKVWMLRHHLVTEYTTSGDYASAEAIHLEDFRADPDHPLPLNSLAWQKFFHEDQPAEAMRVVDQALEVAVRSGVFQRLVLGNKARIALRLEDYRIMEDVLNRIMNTKLSRANADIGVERDFFDGLPPDSIDPAVARRYDEYCRARGKARGADGTDEPPEWEDHEEA